MGKSAADLINDDRGDLEAYLTQHQRETEAPSRPRDRLPVHVICVAIIADILTQVDAAATAVGATAFDAVAAEIVPVFRVGSVLVVALAGINLMAQAVPMTLRNGLGLIVRIAVASAFLSSFRRTSMRSMES